MCTATKERPIIFSGGMVRAILDGRKTQTRRAVKPTRLMRLAGMGNDGFRKSGFWNAGGVQWQYGDERLPPNYQVGDLLWVRETWACIWTEHEPGEDQIGWDVPHRIEYKADSNAKYPGDWPDDCGDDEECPRWSSPIHMLRRASRILLEITGVRVERVQEISELGAFEEGCTGEGYSLTVESFALARQEFEDLWNSINAKRGFGWDVNPWVWVIEFKTTAEAER